jgi:ketose-bisphosphate aldolase
MIARFAEILEHERRGGRAAGAFTCYDLATACGVLDAGERAGVPVILLVSHAAFRGRNGQLLVAALLAAADRCPTAACVQLDHVDELDTIGRALELGLGAVMADGSRLAPDANADFVRAAVRLAERTGAGVEAELGHIEGGEDVAEAARAGLLTDPREAAAFVERSRAACLAVSIGNVHGAYAEPPSLDWDRLAEIRSRVDVPLALHGASGLPEADLRRAVAAGVAKVNLNAELRRRAFAELDLRVPELRSGYRLLELQDDLASAACEVAFETLGRLGGGDAAVGV